MEKGRVFETVVGVVVLVVAALFFNYVYSRSNWKNIDGYLLIAKFDHADGIGEGSEVKISGLKVGKVVSAEVDPENFLAVVKFCIPHNVKLPKDSSATIASDGLLGGKYLALSPGEEDEILKPNEELSNTVGPVSFEGLIGKFLSSKNDD